MNFNLDLTSTVVSNMIANLSGLKTSFKLEGNQSYVEVFTSKKIKIGSVVLILENQMFRMGPREGVCLQGEFSDEVMAWVDQELHKINDLNGTKNER